MLSIGNKSLHLQVEAKRHNVYKTLHPSDKHLEILSRRLKELKQQQKEMINLLLNIYFTFYYLTPLIQIFNSFNYVVVLF